MKLEGLYQLAEPFFIAPSDSAESEVSYEQDLEPATNYAIEY